MANENEPELKSVDTTATGDAHAKQGTVVPTMKDMPPSPESKDIKLLEKNEDVVAELKEMGPDVAYFINKPATPVTDGSFKFGGDLAKTYTFTKGNYALIFRGSKCMRLAPFVRRTDMESRQVWAEFEWYRFFGKSLSLFPWERVRIKILRIGLNTNEHYCETLNGEGYLTKFDENSMRQLPMHAQLTEQQMTDIEEDGRHIAQNLLLYRQLTKYEKPKPNWHFITILAIIAFIIIVVIMIMLFAPNLFNDIGKWFGGLTAGFKIPSAPGA